MNQKNETFKMCLVMQKH